MTISLTDIAERAGVSVKTVSGALHGGSARMSEETRQRIKEIADELGYITNLAARSMRQGWMPLIGVVANVAVLLFCKVTTALLLPPVPGVAV